jgi:type III restriction enzyme
MFMDEIFSNKKIELTESELIENIQEIQQTSVSGLRPDKRLAYQNSILNLTTEMETGTGKTYVYTRSMFELNKHYGRNKFIIMVPSVAIRE